MTSGMVVGVVGGGQLARMMIQEAIPLGIGIHLLVTSPNDPAALVSPHFTVGSAESADDLRRFADSVDVVTFDHEVVDLSALDALERDGHLLRPGAATFGTVSEKVRMRAALADAGIPTPPAQVVASAEEAAAIVADGGGHVLKLAQGGYDGRGTFFVETPDESRRLLEDINPAGTVVLIEPRLDLLAELAVIVVRDPDGSHVVYDPVSTIQIDGQCRRIDAPARQSDEIVESARGLARRAAEAVDAVGVLAVEMFLTADGLVVNELAARPHNTGHHTLDAAVTSQFANHLRAVTGLPLGSPDLHSRAVTANLIGVDGSGDPAARLRDGMAVDPAAHIHLYAKKARHDRKLGHVTICDDDHDRAVARAARVVEALGGQEVPR